MNFFYKEQPVGNPIRWSSGATVNWEMVGNDLGVLATEDAQQIAELDVLIKGRRGGVVTISQEQFEGLKKNPKFKALEPVSPSASPYRLINQEVSLTSPAPSATEQVKLPGDVVETPRVSAPPVAAKPTSPLKPVAPRQTRRASDSTKPLVKTAV